MSRTRAAFHDPDGDRYDIPTYWWRGAPDGYATLRQLRTQGLRPGGQPIAAQVLWRRYRQTAVAYLYRLDLAKPKRSATWRQREAIDRALIARMRCPTCRITRNYFIPRSLGECLDCADDSTPSAA